MDTNLSGDPVAVLIITIGPRPTPGLQATLTELGLRVWTAVNCYGLRSLLSLRDWSLVLLDMSHPFGHSLSSCARVRDLYDGPLAAVTAQITEAKKIGILETGLDDQLTWPMTPALADARLRALARRNSRQKTGCVEVQPPLQVGEISIDPARREVLLNDAQVELTCLEFDLLHLLAENLGRTVSRETISHRLRGLPHLAQDRSIDLRISRLRRKLGDDGRPARLILTVRGIGYQLAAEPVPRPADTISPHLRDRSLLAKGTDTGPPGPTPIQEEA